jgi:hypothetical protein
MQDVKKLAACIRRIVTMQRLADSYAMSWRHDFVKVKAR